MQENSDSIIEQSDDNPSARNFKGWIQQKFHRVDIFSKPIGLKFRKKPVFATVPGGISTIIVFIFFTSFIIVMILQFFLYSGPTDTTIRNRIAPVNIEMYELGPNDINLMHYIGTIDEEIIAEAKAANIPLHEQIFKYI